MSATTPSQAHLDARMLRMIAFLVPLVACVSHLPATLSYTNPVLPAGLADPTIIRHEAVYYMYPTGDTRSYHVYTSRDLVDWQKGERVFTPGGGNVWAPDVFYNEADKTFYLYYTADWKIGVATCDRPDGQFTDRGVLLEGYIDGHLFQGFDGKYYLAYTNLKNLYVQEMTDPLHLGEKRTVAVQPELPWESVGGKVTEGPWVLKHDDKYYMLYSGTGANSPNYAIGYATATDPLGTWTKYADNPIISRSEGVYGPGHGSVTTDDAGNLWHIYHQKINDGVNYSRFICLDPLWFDGQGVLHGRATRDTKEPAPRITTACEKEACPKD